MIMCSYCSSMEFYFSWIIPRVLDSLDFLLSLLRLVGFAFQMGLSWILVILSRVKLGVKNYRAWYLRLQIRFAEALRELL